MKVLLIIVSILLIAIVLLQSGKAVSPSSSILGGNDELFAHRKERGGELFITRLTAVLGLIFFIICIVMQYIG
ncbi:MAG: preprotein translocase subunit SecG [Bacilli bacterium]|nr:preprotein translocase subunit SecG [Bacilli bacterium]